VLTIDAHAHFEPRMLEVPRVLEKMQLAGVSRIALIPAMCDPLPPSPEHLLAAMRLAMQFDGTRRVAELVHRFTLNRDGDLVLGRDTFRIYRQPDNASVADVLLAHPEAFLGWIFLNPRGASPLDELERWRSVRGNIGVKLHPHWHDYETRELHPILARCDELQMPVLIHLGFGLRGDFVDLTSRYPRVNFIAAHAGFPFFQRLWRHGKSARNLYVDLSSPYVSEALVRRAVRALGPERCLYGTDAPYGFHGDDGSYDYAAIQGWVERLPVTSRQREQIFGETLASLARL
jgi:predicted TIM-barrel fold metal-dependent hydrolase